MIFYAIFHLYLFPMIRLNIVWIAQSISVQTLYRRLGLFTHINHTHMIYLRQKLTLKSKLQA